MDAHNHGLEIGLAVIGLLTSGFLAYQLGRADCEAHCRTEKLEGRFDVYEQFDERLRFVERGRA